MGNYTRKKSDDKSKVMGKKSQVFEQRGQKFHVKQNSSSQSNSKQVNSKKFETSKTSDFTNKKIVERGERITKDTSGENEVKYDNLIIRKITQTTPKKEVKEETKEEPKEEKTEVKTVKKTVKKGKK